MTDLEKWKQWLDSWKIKYEVNCCWCNSKLTSIDVDIQGSHCYSCIEFDTESGKFLRMIAYE